MSKRKLSTEQIIGVLKQLEAGRTTAELAREVGVSKHTIYSWKAQFGGMEVNEAEELRSLRDENQRLKKLVADLSLDKEMMNSVIAKRVQLAGLRVQREVGRKHAEHLVANFGSSVCAGPASWPRFHDPRIDFRETLVATNHCVRD